MKDQPIEWWQKPLRIIRYDPLNDFSSFLNGDDAEHAREIRQVCHANCEWIMANGGSSPGTAPIVNFDSPHFEKNPTVGDRDILRDYLPHARREGIRVVAYINLHWFSYEFADAHPGWEQRLADGRSYGRVNPLYGNGTTMCVNTPWRDWAFLLIREATATGIDGVFLDGPVVYPGACYCPVCRDGYASDAGGLAAPEAEDWSEEWMAWIDFRERSMMRFLSEARKAVRSVNPEGIVYLNAGGYRLSTRTARHPWRLESHQDMTGAEVFVHFGVSGEDWLDTAVMAKFLSAGENPAIVFSDHALGGWHYTGMTGEELHREFYQTVAGGASPWIAVFTPALEHQKEKTLDPVRSGWEKLESLDPYLTGDEPAARVAVLRSDATAFAYRSDLDVLRIRSGAAKEEDLVAAGDEQRIDDPILLKRFCEEISVEEFRGWCYMLTRGHVPYSIIRDRDCVSDVLDRFDCLILPGAACLSADALAAIERFIERGGTVVSTFETGWYDERGKRRPGGRGGVGAATPVKLEAFAPANFEEYALIDAELGPLSPGELIPRPEYAIKIEPPEGSETGVRYLEPIGYRYRPPRGVTSYPMLLRADRGTGRWIYFSCLPGREWRRYRIPAWETLAVESVREALGEKVQIRTDAPPTVQIELRRQIRLARTLVHIINNSGDNHFPPSSIVPAGAARLSIRSDRPTRVYDAETGTDLDFVYRAGRVEVHLELTAQYRVLALSGKEAPG